MNKTEHILKRLLVAVVVFVLAAALPQALAQIEDVSDEILPWAGRQAVRHTLYSGGTWAIFGGPGTVDEVSPSQIRITTDMVTFTNKANGSGTGSAQLLAPPGEDCTDVVDSACVVWGAATHGGTWIWGGRGQTLKSTTDWVSFTDHTTQFGFAKNGLILDIDTDGSTWAFSGNSGLFRTSTDLTTFTEPSACSLACPWGTNHMYSVKYGADGSGLWGIGGVGAEFYTTTDLVNYSSKKTLDNWDSKIVYSIEYDSSNDLWMIGGQLNSTAGKPTLNTSTDLSTFTDKGSNLTAGVADADHVLRIEYDTVNDIWGLVGDELLADDIGWVASSTDGITFTDRTSNFDGTPNTLRSIAFNQESSGGLWAVGGEKGRFQTTSALTSSFTDYRRDLALGGEAMATASENFGGSTCPAGNTWAIGGNDSELHATTDMTGGAWSDYTTSLNWGEGQDVKAIAYDGSTWGFGGGENNTYDSASLSTRLATTTNWSTFSPHTSSLNFATSDEQVSVLITDGNTWMIGSREGSIDTTTNFSGFAAQTHFPNVGTEVLRAGAYDTVGSSGLFVYGGGSGTVDTVIYTTDWTDGGTWTGVTNERIRAIAVGRVREAAATAQPTSAYAAGVWSSSGNAVTADDTSYDSTTTEDSVIEYDPPLSDPSETVRGIKVDLIARADIPFLSTDSEQTRDNASATPPDLTTSSSQWTGHVNIKADDSSNATANAVDDVMTIYGWNFDIPDDAVDIKFKIQVNAWQNATKNMRIGGQLSDDGCSTFYPPLATALETVDLQVNGAVDPEITYDIPSSGNFDDFSYTGTLTAATVEDDGKFCVQLSRQPGGGGGNSTKTTYIDYVKLIVQYDDPDGTANFQVALVHPTGGDTDLQSTASFGDHLTDVNLSAGSSGDLWGEVWETAGDIQNMRVKITANSAAGSINTWWLDKVDVTVYTDSTTPVWALGGEVGTLAISTDNFVTKHTNKTSQLQADGWGNEHVRSIAYSEKDGVWLIGGRSNNDGWGRVYQTLDFDTFYDMSETFGIIDEGYKVLDMTPCGSTFLLAGAGILGTTNEGSPLAVDLIAFEARPFDSEVEVFWETGSEFNNIGFNIYRKHEDGSHWDLLTEQPIQGLNNSGTGGKYLFVDNQVENGTTYHYYLEDIDLFTGGTLHGPVSARPESALGPAQEMTAEQQNDYAGVVYGANMLAAGESPENAGIDANAARVSVTHSGGNTSTIELTLPAAQLEDQGEGKELVKIDGFGQLELPDKPIVPFRGLLVGVPCRTLEGLRVEVGAEDQLADLQLPIGAQLLLRDAYGNEIPFDSPENLFPEQLPGEWNPPREGTYPAKYVEVGEVQCSGGEGRLTLSLLPLLYDGNQQLGYQARQLQLTIDWGDELSATKEYPEAPVSDLLAADAGALKLALKESGVYRVSAAELSALGWDTESILRDQLHLYRAGSQIQIDWLGPASETIGEGSAFEFYADYQWLKRTPENVYWLTVSNSGLPATARAGDLAVDPAAPEAGLRQESHIEKNPLYISSFDAGPDADRYFWKIMYVAPSFTMDGQLDFALIAPDTASPSPARLTYEVRSAGSDVHRLIATLNGTQIDTFNMLESALIKREVEVAPGLLIDGQNRLELKLVDLEDGKIKRALANWVEVAYTRTAVWNGAGQLELVAETSGTGRLSGLPAEVPVAIWDVTDPRAPKVMQADSDVGGGLVWPVKAGHKYRLAAESLAVERIWPNRSSQLRLLTPSDALYISHKDFLPAAEILAQHRRVKRAVTVVDVEDVYDQFGSGDVSDVAITAFAQFWKERLGSPFTLLIFGDASYDPHSYMGHAFEDFVPTHLKYIGYFETASDYRLANGDQSGASAIRVGRLPAKTPAEAQTMVNKIIDYEDHALSQEEWTREIALFSDNAQYTWEKEFERLNVGLQAMLEPDYQVDLELLRDLSTEEMRQQIQDHFNEGSLLINYFGHGAFNFWAQEQLLTNDDLELMHNADRLPIVTALNCLNGYFIPSGYTSLAERMLSYKDGGAVAFVSSSGMNTVGSLKTFGLDFYRTHTVEQPQRLGTLVGKVLGRLPNHRSMRNLRETLHLFGDPDSIIAGRGDRLSDPPVDISLTGDGPAQLDLNPDPSTHGAQQSSGSCGLVSSPSGAFGSVSFGLLIYCSLLVFWFRRNHLALRRAD